MSIDVIIEKGIDRRFEWGLAQSRFARNPEGHSIYTLRCPSLETLLQHRGTLECWGVTTGPLARRVSEPHAGWYAMPICYQSDSLTQAQKDYLVRWDAENAPENPEEAEEVQG